MSLLPLAKQYLQGITDWKVHSEFNDVKMKRESVIQGQFNRNIIKYDPEDINLFS